MLSGGAWYEGEGGGRSGAVGGNGAEERTHYGSALHAAQDISYRVFTLYPEARPLLDFPDYGAAIRDGFQTTLVEEARRQCRRGLQPRAGERNEAVWCAAARVRASRARPPAACARRTARGCKPRLLSCRASRFLDGCFPSNPTATVLLEILYPAPRR